MLSFHAVLITEFCFGLLPQVAAIKKKCSTSTYSQNLSAKFVLFWFDLNQSPGRKPISRNGYGPDWQLEQDSKNAGVTSFFFFVCGYQIVGHGPRRS